MVASRGLDRFCCAVAIGRSTSLGVWYSRGRRSAWGTGRGGFEGLAWWLGPWCRARLHAQKLSRKLITRGGNIILPRKRGRDDQDIAPHLFPAWNVRDRGRGRVH